jgi:phospholipid/cholesterol/gamma-HCH transport system substrate-binding protein
VSLPREREASTHVSRAITRHAREFLAIVVLLALALTVTVYITSHERLALPSWVPFVGQKFFVLHAEFTTAQAVTPGQGQTIDVSGVAVGRISSVGLSDGHAVVTAQIEPHYDAVYSNATILLRPKTGLKDMVLELDPGSARGGRRLHTGATLPVSRTLPDVNLDEVLAGLDGDTRDWLRLLLSGAGAGLQGNGRRLADVFRRFDPTARDLSRAAALVVQRRAQLRRLIHNFRLLVEAVGAKDQDLTRFVNDVNGSLRPFARQNQRVSQSISLLPAALGAADRALRRTDRLARTLRPTAASLQPTGRAFAPAVRAARPFFAASTPIFRRQLRPFTRAALPTVRILRPAAHRLARATPGLTSLTTTLDHLLNALAYQAPGGPPGYLFYIPWLNHDGDSIFTGQDAAGPVRRGIVLASCGSLSLLGALASPTHNPTLATIIQLLNPPALSKVCPNVPTLTPTGATP